MSPCILHLLYRRKTRLALTVNASNENERPESSPEMVRKIPVSFEALVSTIAFLFRILSVIISLIFVLLCAV